MWVKCQIISNITVNTHIISPRQIDYKQQISDTLHVVIDLTIA